MGTQKNDDAHLRLASKNVSVVGEELSKDTTGVLDYNGKCGNVDEEDILSAFLP
jgi:hypothetical protein